MSKTTDLFNLLKQREGEWVSRDDLNFLGGEDTGRRMREVETLVAGMPEFRLDERHDHLKRLEYRLVALKVDPHDKTALERYQYECTKCGSHPQNLQLVVRSLDDRYRIGPCRSCHTKGATFRKIGA